MLNEYYASVSRTSQPLQPSDVADVLSQPLLGSLPSMFEFRPITGLDIDQALFNFSKNCTGSDGLSTDMIKLTYPVLRSHLVEIFNKSIESGEYPDDWKLASILPLLKKNPPMSPSDTRPIALLPELSKLFERVIYNQLFSYLNTHNLLDPMQSGYKPHHSTQTALLNFTEDVRAAIERRMVTVSILFDFSKAFDVVSHRLLLEKPSLIWAAVFLPVLIGVNRLLRSRIECTVLCICSAFIGML